MSLDPRLPKAKMPVSLISLMYFDLLDIYQTKTMQSIRVIDTVDLIIDYDQNS